MLSSTGLRYFGPDAPGPETCAVSATAPIDLEPARRTRSRFSESLRELAHDASRERISMADLLQALGDRALAALMFVFAAPNVLPVPPGTSAILGAPLVFLAAQLTFGRQPWLPAFIANRSMAREDFAALVRRIAPWIERAERLMRPRMTWLVEPPTEYFIGLICLLLSIVLTLPVPLGNVLPALAISVLALGIVERDGLWVLGGMAVAVVASAVVFGVVVAMVKTTFFLIANVLN